MLESTRLRKHMPIYFLKADSPANVELNNNNESIIKKRVFLGKLLSDIVWNDETTVTINGTKCYAWAAVAENKWSELTKKQQEEIHKVTRETYDRAKDYFQPFMYKPVSSGGDLEFTFS